MFKVVDQISSPDIRIVEEAPLPSKWSDSLAVPSVGPDGQFNVTFFDRRLMRKGEPIKQGLTPVTYDQEQGIGLARWARDQGHVLYENLCKGEVAGVEASHQHWQIWISAVKLYASNRAPARGALEKVCEKLGLQSIFHPEVNRRRSQAANGGLFALGPDELLKFMGLDGVVADALDDELTAEIARASLEADSAKPEPVKPKTLKASNPEPAHPAAERKAE
jgi:hypothetical protein